MQIINCKEILTKQMNDKPVLIKHFNECLEEDIKRLFQRIEDIRIEIVKDWLLNEDSDPVEVNDTLENLSEKLSSCRKVSEEYQCYQQELNVCEVIFFLFCNAHVKIEKPWRKSPHPLSENIATMILLCAHREWLHYFLSILVSYRRSLSHKQARKRETSIKMTNS